MGTDDQSSPSIVEYGTSPGRYSSVAQASISLIFEELCHNPPLWKIWKWVIIRNKVK
jgi:hypothetical protein